MSYIAIFNPTAAKTGIINKAGLTYTVTIQNTGGTYYNRLTSVETRAYLSYDTSTGIPANATVIKVEFNCNVIAAAGTPVDWITQINMGTFIGGALDSSDWNGGTQVLDKDWDASPADEVIDLGSKGILTLNLSGDTDLCFRDDSLWDAGSSINWSYTKYLGTGRGGQLYVTYTLPAIYNATLHNCTVVNA